MKSNPDSYIQFWKSNRPFDFVAKVTITGNTSTGNPGQGATANLGKSWLALGNLSY